MYNVMSKKLLNLLMTRDTLDTLAYADANKKQCRPD